MRRIRRAARIACQDVDDARHMPEHHFHAPKAASRKDYALQGTFIGGQFVHARIGKKNWKRRRFAEICHSNLRLFGNEF